jgi:hypothetical protein
MQFHIQHPIPIPLEDEHDLVHTDDSPFCLDPSCPDKEDKDAIDAVAQIVENGLMTPAEATRFVQGRQL